MMVHMKYHADILRPKFEAVDEILKRELDGLGIGTWTTPRGGYFMSFDSLEGCAKKIVSRCKKAGLDHDKGRGYVSLWERPSGL